MSKKQPIAIVGYAYRAPGVGREKLWDMLKAAGSAWSSVPADRFDASAYTHADSAKVGCMATQGAHFLPGDVYAFDAPFFQIRPDEARYMDPQVRMLLECAWEAVENAGMRPIDLAQRRVGVFSAASASEYAQQLLSDMPTTSTWAATGITPCMSSNRLSHFFDLIGPSVSLDAACASGAYAVHLACQSLWAGECEAALAGASALILVPEMFSMLDTVGTLSPQGRSFSYDHKADGFGRGEGAACLVLKPLDEAIRCGDPVQAVICNTAASHCGRTPGISMPSQAAHEALLRALHEGAGVDPDDTPYIEGHGTGTVVGDPVEAAAIAAVFGSNRSSLDPVHVGSIKSNIGHLETASGLLSIVKSIMMVQHELMIPTAGFEKLNPAIEGGDKLKVLQKPSTWPERAPRRICISNYGFGGSNAAILLENGPACSNCSAEVPNSVHSLGESYLARERSTQPQRLFVFSAKFAPSLDAYLGSMINYLKDQRSSPLEFTKDLCFTLGQRRTHWPYRAALAADNPSTLREKLLTHSNSQDARSTRAGEPIVAFVFTGQGAQYAEMAMGLLEYPVFAKAIAEAGSHLNALGATFSLPDELAKTKSDSRIDDAEISQPACTAIQISLVRLLRAFGVVPTAVIGHSSGEIAAAYAAGHVSFHSALANSFFRGRATKGVLRDENLRGGAMIALGADETQATQLLRGVTSGYATIAAYNSPNSITLSGDAPTIDEIHKKAEGKGLFSRKLRVGVAYHSCHMSSAAKSYAAAMNSTPESGSDPLYETTAAPEVIFASSVTGNFESKETLGDKAYWINNLLQPVKFAPALERLLQSTSVNTIVEIGPHLALQKPIIESLDHLERTDVTYLASLKREFDDQASLLDLCARLFTAGCSLNFGEVNFTSPGTAQVLKDLPPYEWNKSNRYIHTSRITRHKLHPGYPYNPLLGWKSAYNEGADQSFRKTFTLDEMPWLRDHSVGGETVFPVSGFLSLAVEAVRCICGSGSISSLRMQEVHIPTSLAIKEDERVDLTTRLRPREANPTASRRDWRFEIMSWSDSTGWILHCYGQVQPEQHQWSTRSPLMKQAATIADTAELSLPSIDVEQEYAAMERLGIAWGPAFRAMTSLRAERGTCVHTVEVREQDRSRFFTLHSPITVDPPLLDALGHAAGAVQGPDTSHRGLYMPTYIRRLHISNRITADSLTSVTRMCRKDSRSGDAIINVAAFAKDVQHECREPVMEMESLHLKCIGAPSPAPPLVPESYVLEHIPSLDLANKEYLASLLPPWLPTQDELWHSQRMGEVGIYYTARGLKAVDGTDLSHLPSYFKQWFIWARKLVSNNPFDKLQVESSISEVAQRDVQGAMVCAVGESLVSILQGQVKPLEVIMQDGMLDRCYEEDAAVARGGKRIADYVRLLSEATPDLSVLEVGGGTAGTTPAVLEALASHEQPRYHYSFTDISAGFFEKAKEKLSRFGSAHLAYQKLDISQDPLEQGFRAATFDLVIASNVLHATPDIVLTLKNVSTLLKPGGKLVLLELVNPSAALLPFTLLPGWWPSRDPYRSPEDGPLLPATSWERALVETGFSGIDISIPVAAHPLTHETLMAVMCSSKRREPPGYSRMQHCSISISGQLEDGRQRAFASNVVAELRGISHLVEGPEIVPLLDFNPTDDKFCIIIDRPKQSLLADLSQEAFEALKHLLHRVRKVLWVIPADSEPEAHSAAGFLRALRHEDSSREFQLFVGVPQDNAGAAAVAKVAQYSDMSGVVELEYSWADGQIMLPRLQRRQIAREAFLFEAGHPHRKLQPLGQDRDRDHIELNADTTDSAYFQRLFDSGEVIAGDEVKLRVEAIGLTARDNDILLGRQPWHSPGFQGVGRVVRTGSEVGDLTEADRVMFVSTGGSCATYCRLPREFICKLPSCISVTGAAAIPMAYLTAHVAIMQMARVDAGDMVLVCDGSTPVGQSCILIAQRQGAQIFTTAETEGKRKALCDDFGLEPGRVFGSHDCSLREDMLVASRGHGLDVIIENAGGISAQEKLTEMLSDFGRLVTAQQPPSAGNPLVGGPRAHNCTVNQLDILHLMPHRPQAVAKGLEDLVQLLKERPTTLTPLMQDVVVLPVSQLEAGVKRLQPDDSTKIVLTFEAPDMVLTESRSPWPTRPLLVSEATYIITGGTGGIGRALATWMIDQGAGHVVLLGRSGSSHPKVAALLEQHPHQLRAIACDVGDRSQLEAALASIHDIPPVRGVVHAAMYLRDSLLVNATFDDWLRITRPKVQGAWNLDALLPNLDFFISLASMDAVVGHIGQSIYSGTSSFLNAFSQQRIARGLNTVSINLPVVDGVGYVVERSLTESLKTSFGVSLAAGHVITLVKGAIVGPSSGLNINGTAISGVLTPMDMEMPWERWPHLRSLSAGLKATKTTAEVHARTEKNGDSSGKAASSLTGPNSTADFLASLTDKVAEMTMMDVGEVPVDQGMNQIGLDSLVSVELRNWIRRNAGVELSLAKITGAGSLRKLAAYVMSQR